MNFRKGQSAIEYLMNYAWAIALIIIVGVAIFALDVGGLRSSVVGQGSRATAGAQEVQIVDYTYDADENLTLVIQNNAANTINLTNVSVVTIDGSSSGVSNSTDDFVSPGNNVIRIVSNVETTDRTAGQSFEAVVEISYTDVVTTLDKKSRVTISGVVQTA